MSVNAVEKEQLSSWLLPSSVVSTFEPEKLLVKFAEQFPEEFQIFRVTGVHPTEPKAIVNPYSDRQDAQSFQNIGLHLLAVAQCAAAIAERLKSRGVISIEEERDIVRRALVHDVGKPFEIMRRNAVKSGVVEEAYNETAYAELEAHLVRAGLSPSMAEFITRAGSETGHLSLKNFIAANPSGDFELISSRLSDKVVHIADAMTYTSNPQGRTKVVAAYLTCWERMLATGSIEKYPFMWSNGLARRADGTLAVVSDITNIGEALDLVGSYAELHVRIASSIAAELTDLMELEVLESPELSLKEIASRSVSLL